jgi:tetratricopeptide (TPR) repeat protein
VTTLCLELDKVDWDAVAATADPGDVPPHVFADALSLSALFTNEFSEALARVANARDSDPLNPLHTARQILVLLRFGESGRALEVAGPLQEQLPSLALPAYLRALATYREGEYKRAANAAALIIADHPAFAPARFLQAESQLRSQFKGLRKLLTGLPRGEAHMPAWLDITTKLVLSGNDEGKALAAEVAADATIFLPGSREKAVVDDLLVLCSARLEELEARLEAIPAGSRAEELVLLFHMERLDDEMPLAASVNAMRRLWGRFPARSAVRRAYVARLARMAVDLSSREKYVEALRLVERCVQLEPSETVHFQNRAALFTLLREPGAYHDAWLELDRHQFRLALLGRVTPAHAIELARSHRLFAQQARFQAHGPASSAGAQGLGFLMEVTRTNDTTGAVETVLAVNNERIDDDPELLRQWIHHRRAELTFGHWALGCDARRFLLGPESVPAARARLAALTSAARSLEVLVADEGRLLAAKLVGTWQSQADKIEPAYAPLLEGPDERATKQLHLETFADLAILCLTWKPPWKCRALVEEVLAFLDEESAFFDDAVIQQSLRTTQTEASYPLKLLGGFINNSLGLDSSRSNPLDDEQRAAVTGRLAAELLTRMAYQAYEELRGTDSGARIALAYVERARSLDPDNVRTELTAARFLLIAGRDEDSRAILTQLGRSARAREPEVHAEIEELRRILDERAGGGARSRPSTPGEQAPIQASPSALLADLEAEIDRFPSAVHAYEELAKKLAASGRFDDALGWSERAMTHCLGRDGQLRARSLNMEVLGLRKLWDRDQVAVQLYITGAHRPALELLETIPPENQNDYALEFLLGQCRLALGSPDDARLAFEQALEHCGRQLHRTVLRGLAMDVDQPYLVLARRSIADKLAIGAFEPALREAWAMTARLRRKEAAFADLAQIHLEAALKRAGTDVNALPPPTERELGLAGSRLADVYTAASDLERARRLARLAVETDEFSRRKAELILRKADALEERAAIAAMLGRSGDLLRQGQFALALGELDLAVPSAAAEPRVIRQRALLLLKLERFEEAETAAAGLQGSKSSVATELLESFPALVFRQRVAVACRMLRDGDSAQALAVLEGAVAVDRGQSVELAYCVGFALTLDAYRMRRVRNEAGAKEALRAAMDRVEPLVAAARDLGHSRLIDLYETLDKELDHQ